jgi:ferredoxin-NADP reductase/predicted pyridoxine 5'-phosphate oxidase superfamily flavin-nucleotide-binding protein
MAHKFAEIAFTQTVRRVQEAMGSRSGYAAMDSGPDHNNLLSEREKAFIEARDSFYMASVSETGWPYLQHRGGPAGFLKVLDQSTLGFADYSGNRQYVTTGNVLKNDRVAVFFMDYPNRVRLKLLGRMELVDADDTPKMVRLEDDGYRARVERGMIIHIEAFDWNCPQHITPRYSQAEVDKLIELEREENRDLRSRAEQLASPNISKIGEGELELIVTGVRQLADRIRAFELRAPSGEPLPEIKPGAHIEVPVVLGSSTNEVRRYSIASNPNRRDVYEIAVFCEPDGRGGSDWIHKNYQLGSVLGVSLPINYFDIQTDTNPAVLIAGGIGITPIKSIAQALQDQTVDFELHYTGRKASAMAYLDRLQREFGPRMTSYVGDLGQRMDLERVLASAPANAEVYVCGPAKLIDGVLIAANQLGIDRERVHFERFNAQVGAGARPVEVTLLRSGEVLHVTPDQTLLDAILDAGVEIPNSCRVGQCKSCAVKVLAGEPEHWDEALTPFERDSGGLMCPCVSRAKGNSLVLDI